MAYVKQIAGINPGCYNGLDHEKNMYLYGARDAGKSKRRWQT